MASSETDLILNGIDPISGEALAPPMTLENAARQAAGGPQSHPAVVAMHENLAKPTLGLPFGCDPMNPAQAGWGLMFHSSESAEVKSAFDVLLHHRPKSKTLIYSGEDFETWLANNGVAPGTVKPTRVPFYLLVVGDPALIPLDFTQLLSIEYAVGRLHLDSAADYARYAQAVVDYETKPEPTNAKEAVFFASKHINDAATNLSCEQLIKPLANGTDGDPGIADGLQFHTTKILEGDAKKQALLGVLTRPAPAHPPAILFTATHGLGWPLNDDRQKTAQGALLCGDWLGRGFSPVPIVADQFLSAADLSQANVGNLVAFFFACFGLATPQTDQYSFNPPDPPKQLAPKVFFSPLPQALLSAPSGPALAVIGHVERAWASSIAPPGAGPQLQPFQNAVGKILTGVPLGLALKDFSDRYGAFAGLLNKLLGDKVNNLAVDSANLASVWLQRNDAQSYLLFGDPAIRLRPEKLA